MPKPDDSSLTPRELEAVEKRARELLNRAAAWDRFPTPIADILAAASLHVAPKSAFDPNRILEYVKHKSAKVTVAIKSAIAKVLGLYDGDESVIHIDDTVGKSKQNFLKLHETGHHELPTHRKVFRIFQDCEKTLAPETADLFEREANNFARFALFQGTRFAECAADMAFELKTPMSLSKKFGASVYAAAREFARTNRRACIVYILEPIEYVIGIGAQARVRRIEPSPLFVAQFGKPSDEIIGLDHPFGPLLPLGRKMTRPRALALKDLNGTLYDCVGEAFDTRHNVLILVYPERALKRSVIVSPSIL